MNEFNPEMICNEDTAMDAVEAAVDIVNDVAANPGSGITSRMGIVAGVVTVVGLVVGGVMLWRKRKAVKEEELRQPDEDAPVELSDEDIAEITTAE